MAGDLAEEAVAFVHGLEDAGGDEGLLGGGHLEEAAEDVLAVQVAEVVGVGESDGGRDGEEVLLGLGGELQDVEGDAGRRNGGLHGACLRGTGLRGDGLRGGGLRGGGAVGGERGGLGGPATAAGGRLPFRLDFGEAVGGGVFF